VGGKRYRRSLETGDLRTAIERRSAYEKQKAIGTGRVLAATETPRLRDFAARYLEEDLAHLADTTRSDRPAYLREDGPILSFLGDRHLDEITPAMLREWWAMEIQRPRQRSRGRGKLKGEPRA
jgi:hypothetical protein